MTATHQVQPISEQYCEAHELMSQSATIILILLQSSTNQVNRTNPNVSLVINVTESAVPEPGFTVFQRSNTHMVLYAQITQPITTLGFTHKLITITIPTPPTLPSHWAVDECMALCM